MVELIQSSLHNSGGTVLSFFIFYGTRVFSRNIPKPSLLLGLTWQITCPLQVHRLQLSSSGVYFSQHLYTLPENVGPEYIASREQEKFDYCNEFCMVIPEKQQEQELIGDGCDTAFGVFEQIPVLSSMHLSVNDIWVH